MAALTDYALTQGRLHTGVLDATSDLSALDSRGTWLVVLPYHGDPLCVRFERVDRIDPVRTRWWTSVTAQEHPWPGVNPDTWSTSLDRSSFIEGVERIRSEIAEGNLYQANLTRRMRAPVGPGADIGTLGRILLSENPAPHSAIVDLPSLGVHMASASPELFLARRNALIRTSPIKGTAATPDGFLAKDTAENVMIVDLMRNDLGRICEWGSIHTTGLLEVERHPGLFHLVSTIEGTLRADVGWPEIIDATFPPGSVTGAPKLAATELIDRLENEDRGFYCGAIGWVDADTASASLNVAIRTFWMSEGELNFGTGGGITFGSSPEGEWDETVLKAARLLSVAARSGDDAGASGDRTSGHGAAPLDDPGPRNAAQR